MTLVVAGFDYDGSVVFCADSLITGKNNGLSVKLVSSFRKIVPVELVINIPIIDRDGKILRYQQTLSEHRCMVAFAGSTLISRHIMNNIEGHLKQIKYTYNNDDYILIMGCEDNSSVENNCWDESMYNIGDDNLYDLISKNFLVNLFTHCIKDSIKDFITQSSSEFNEAWFRSDFIIAFSCNAPKRNYLYTFKMNFDDSGVSLIVNEIDKSELAIIGISRYNTEIIDSITIQRSSPDFYLKSHLLNEVRKAVIDNEEVNLLEIGFPIATKTFDMHREITSQFEYFKK
ncbi:hypothetical protein ACPENL_003141 [Yersinia enterocolitica]|nr:hypothetical protein [Yersinia enterocolitica]HEN3490875.1 hypothetical protein [Yersinia enterocolitica]